MGKHNKRQPPTLYSPLRTYFSGGLLICLTIGLVAAGVHESYLARDWWWFAGFMLGEAGCFVLYFGIVRAWISWTTLTSDYISVCTDVVCPDEYEHDEHPGRY